MSTAAAAGRDPAMMEPMEQETIDPELSCLTEEQLANFEDMDES